MNRLTLALALAGTMLLPVAATAQIAIFAVNNGQETPAGSLYDFGKVAVGETKQVVFRMRNTGSATVMVTTLTVSSANFSFVNGLLPPINLLPNNFQDFTVAFVANSAANYSANLQVNSISVLLTASSIAAAPSSALAIFSVANGQETPVSSTYDFGNIAVGDTKQVIFRIRNNGTGTVTLTTLSVKGNNFSFVNGLLVPINILPGNFQEITIAYVAGSIPSGSVARDSANFQVNSIGVLLMASPVATATLSSGVGCTGPLPTGGTITFPNIQAGTTATCTYSLRNQNNQSVTVSNFSISGTGFAGPQGLKTPLTLLAGEFVTFTISFTPPAAIPYAATMVIDSRTFQLAGNGTAPPLSTPVLDTQATAVHSGQQRLLTVQLPSPAPFPVTGNISLTYVPDSTLIQDDPSVMFVPSGARSIGFSIKQGDTLVSLGGQPSAMFQTGSSSGRIRFSMTASTPVQGDPTKVVIIPPDPVAIDSASALKTVGALQIALSGLDNTLAAGAMKFTFYDLSGKVLNDGAISADFSTAFRNYFSQSTVAGMFRAQVNFVVNGDASQVGSVDVQITNPAGSASTARLTFPY